ncbi:MAG TPA: hypothetical protein VF137_07355 [Candidatus Dormibacteraeota bacterium]
MARKSKRRSTSRPRPRPQLPQQPQAPRSDGPSAPAAAAPAPAAGTSSQRVGGDQALVRAVEMSLAPPQQIPKRGSRGVVLDTGDAAIPLDRVPYFISDLRRLGITGGVMLALLVVAAVTIIPQVVK